MFSKLKQIKDLRDQAKKIQSVLGEEKAIAESKGVKITMNGNQQLLDIDIPKELLTDSNKEKLQNAIKDAHSDVMKKIQGIMARKMQDLQKTGDFQLPKFD